MVELLDTDDVLDKRFPIQSSTELYHLNLLVEWAKASGLVGVAPGRIVAVRKHAKLLWQDCHLHVFERGSDRYGFPDPELEIRDDRQVMLGALLAQPGDRLAYEYDFGDCWDHEIVLEAVAPSDGQGSRCTDGAGRCPPEDVGGFQGYKDLRRVLAAPDADGHAEMLDWLGIERASDFDPAAFSAEDASKAIAGFLIAWRT
ncbi:MAG: plasmid pRiA4b ORF-3 family protein [Solirubrobacteraceae bacterium]